MVSSIEHFSDFLGGGGREIEHFSEKMEHCKVEHFSAETKALFMKMLFFFSLAFLSS